MTKPLIPEYENLPAPMGYQSFLKDIGPLACDHYALTMTLAAWKLGFVEERVTTANVYCRSLMNNGDIYRDSGTDEVKNVKVPYLVNAGLGLVAEWMDGWRWGERELRFLAQKRVIDEKGDEQRVFPDEFLFWLSKQKLTLDMKAIPEGELLFPQEPSLRLTGPWWQQMAVEGMILSLISSSTNLATVASQVRLAAQREGAVLVQASLADMALRRSMGIASLQTARGAYMTGWDNTSNDYAGLCYGIPVMGTFAHAWVMLHDTEEEAFENWAAAFPDSAVFLVDTYSSLEGVKRAIRVCRRHDIKLKGIRLDSGNLAYLSREARSLLDEAGYQEARILATDSVSIRAAASLYQFAQADQSAVTGFGIGSAIAVNRDNPLLSFVMKLSASHGKSEIEKDSAVRELIKISDSEQKRSLPGLIDVIRYEDGQGKWAGDTIIPDDLILGEESLSRAVRSVSILNGKTRVFPEGTPFVRLLKPWMKRGAMLEESYATRDAASVLKQSRQRHSKTMAKMDASHLLLPPNMPHRYGVGLAEELAQKRAAGINPLRVAP